MTADRTAKLRDTGTELVAEAGGVELLRYVYQPDMAEFEGRKPYFHPLRSTAGDVVTGYRPNDHRWHKGLQMTASHVSGQNFWGGGSFVDPEQGYVDLPNLGTMRHEEFTAPGRERLTWHTQAGEHWVDEERGLAVRDVEDDSWVLDFSTALTNVRGEPLRFGSPTTAGRPMAGYTGLFWRGPRAFTDGVVTAEGGQGGPEMMGRTAGWLAYTGTHDEVDRASTLLFLAAPGTTWFVRTTPFPAVNPSLAFFSEVELAPGDTWRLAYRVVVADGAWDRDRLEAYVRDHPWQAEPGQVRA
ncbi:oxidoreductase [Sphaerisporangium rufum]|uniref:Oxidoreductase n=1 Tax=Sphaerisporangium rufum TaxID=1381558 RepID=A0A919R0V5_9ACTN|nr:PmoA family protein [Sphaerisporangium rufum]GII76345.1 oxidoreductase [Sphaerisporangium rufum]